MHFGASVDSTDGSFKKFHLRRLNDESPKDQLDANDEDDGLPPGPAHQLREISKIEVPLRQPQRRVVDVVTLAQRLKQKLEDLNARVKGTDFTSADFGVEMVESPGRVVFDVTNKEGL